MTFQEPTLARALDSEVADWSGRGYRVVSRTPTTVQLAKPKRSTVGVVIVWLFVCLGWLLLWMTGVFGTSATMMSLLVVAFVFAVGLVLILVVGANQREQLIYLSISRDGSISQR